MADEEDPWGFDDAGDSAPAAPAPEGPTAESTTEVKSDAPDSANVPSSGDATEAAMVEGGTEMPAPPPLPEDDGYRKPVQLYKHWVRPKFLQYKYMYNYRTNYYDDVIDYLDKKQIGVSREIPRPQTWAERVLRSNYCSARDLDAYMPSIKRDKQLIQTLAATIRTYNYHTKAYINQKYSHVL